jgi:epoxyqueuosine reductase
VRVDEDKSLEGLIKAKAAEIGFAACGIARADAAPAAGARLRAWLADGRHGSMIWMEERAHHRESPGGLWPEVRSVISLGMSYAPATDPLALAGAGETGRISVYAQGQDYHDVVKRRLKELARWIVGAAADADVKVFVDTAPVMEKPLAEAAGLGWQGKHTNLVSREHGSWLFLGAIYTTLELASDEPKRSTCGSCNACVAACPTDAFPAPYQLDARRCISYLTIEHKGPIPHEFRAAMGNRIYGCDDCLAVCPWNKFASTSREARLVARDELNAPALGDLVALDDSAFRALFAGSPIKRIGHARFLRNVLIAIGNSGDNALAAPARERLGDADPLIRGAAVWATRRLAAPDEADALALDFLPRETDISVRTEWTQTI